jgi:hypothetical protein
MSSHLKQSHQSYFSHMTWAVRAGARLITTGIVSIIHGLFPSLFEKYTAKIIIDLYYTRLHNHPNPEYQEMINGYRKE